MIVNIVYFFSYKVLKINSKIYIEELLNWISLMSIPAKQNAFPDLTVSIVRVVLFLSRGVEEIAADNVTRGQRFLISFCSRQVIVVTS